MQRINPNSFISFKAEWTWHEVRHEVEITTSWKNIVNMEKFNRFNPDDEHNYFIRVNMIMLKDSGDSGGNRVSGDTSNPSSYKVIQYKLTETIYEEIKSKLALVNFNIPVIETHAQIREIIKEEMAKTRIVSSAISQLDVCTE